MADGHLNGKKNGIHGKEFTHSMATTGILRGGII